MTDLLVRLAVLAPLVGLNLWLVATPGQAEMLWRWWVG